MCIMFWSTGMDVLVGCSGWVRIYHLGKAWRSGDTKEALMGWLFPLESFCMEWFLQITRGIR